MSDNSSEGKSTKMCFFFPSEPMFTSCFKFFGLQSDLRTPHILEAWQIMQGLVKSLNSADRDVVQSLFEAMSQRALTQWEPIVAALATLISFFEGVQGGVSTDVTEALHVLARVPGEITFPFRRAHIGLETH